MDRFLRASTRGQLAALDGGSFRGVAFGAEFCPRRLPAPDDVRFAQALCRERGLAFALVTPLAREGAFDDVLRWVEECSIPDTEIVFNDWGLLYHAREWVFAKTAGRLLSRQRRDPRVAGMLAAAAPEEARALTGSQWDDPEACALLERWGVTGVELDALPWGGATPPALPPSIALTVAGPWVPVTLSPSCPWTPDPLRCAAPCAQAQPVRLETDEEPTPLWSQGLAQFLRVDEACVEREANRLGASRLVLSREIPA